MSDKEVQLPSEGSPKPRRKKDTALSKKVVTSPREIPKKVKSSFSKGDVVVNETFGEGTVVRKNTDNTFAVNFGGSLRDIPEDSLSV